MRSVVRSSVMAARSAHAREPVASEPVVCRWCAATYVLYVPCATRGVLYRQVFLNTNNTGVSEHHGPPPYLT